MNKRKVVAVVFGGQSGEHEVSIMSSSNIIKEKKKKKYDVVTIGITKQGKWMIYSGDAENIQNDNGKRMVKIF